MSKNLNNFQLSFPENQKKNSNLSTTRRFSFSDLGDFIEERRALQRALDASLRTDLKVDFSDFENHVFFDSAVSKFDIAKDKVLNKYPYNGTLEEKESYKLSSSLYENYIFDTWPHYVGYTEFDGTDQYITASDVDNDLRLGSSSLYVSSWINPVVSTQNIILQVVSASVTPDLKQGYDLYLSGATDPHIKFTLYSGSQQSSISAAYADFTESFNNVAVIYNRPADLLSLYINADRRVSSSVGYSASIEFAPIDIFIGSGSQYVAASSSYDFYSGSIDEVRVLHTASELYHLKNYNRPIYPALTLGSSSDQIEDYLKLNYKFNEGITGTGSIDSIAVDYSKNAIHGYLLNYDTAMRVSGTVMKNDLGDPILYSFHSGVIAFTSSLDISASLYDNDNNNLIYNLIPEVVLLEDDDLHGVMRSFSLAMARFFDELKLSIDQFDNLRITNYQDIDETPDLFLPYLTKYFGWKIAEHFGDSNPLSFFFGDGVLSTGSLDVPLVDIRNQFWRRVLGNLPYLWKTKGKRHNLDAFFNTIGIGKDNINIKEYGYLPGSSIQDTRIHKEKSVSLLGVGTGTFGNVSSSFIKAPASVGSAMSSYTIEALAQLPYVSASYSGSLLTGSIWQFVEPSPAGLTGSFTLLWNIASIGATSGKFILTASDGQEFSSSDVAVFDGDIVNIAAGLNASQMPFIEVRTIDNDVVDLSSSHVGTTAFSGVFTGSSYDFIIGANSGSIFPHETQGFYGEVRYWSRFLSSSELDDHALHFESVGVYDPLETPQTLQGHWALNENTGSDSIGVTPTISDLSRNSLDAVGREFNSNENPYTKFLLEYNYLSPSIDLKWSENKIRIRNKTELTIDDVASDTNEVSLEFNLIDSLNQDISKIFTTFDVVNNLVGKPVNKYRDEYSDLEALGRVYFDRLGDSLNFTNFFKLFRWFDKKLSDSIKQLLPARVKFIGGEQVIESHFLERSKYGYKYPIFRTPQDIPNMTITATGTMDGSKERVLEANSMMGTYPSTIVEKEIFSSSLQVTSSLPRKSSVVPECFYTPSPVSHYSDGAERVDRNPENFFRTKYSGDTQDTVNDPSVGSNFKSGFPKRLIADRDKKNFDGTHSGTFVHPQLGNAFRVSSADSSKDQEHYFDSYAKNIKLSYRGVTFKKENILLSGTDIRDIYVDYNENIFAVGSKGVTSQGENWWILKSTNDGETWREVDLYNGPASGTDICHGIIQDPNAGVGDPAKGTGIFYAVGQHEVTGSFDVIGSASWVDVDRFMSTAGGGDSFTVNDIVRAPDGRFYYVAEGADDAGEESFIVRMSPEGDYIAGHTGSWTEISTKLSGPDSYGYGIAVDSDSKIYAVGSHDDGTNNQNWYVMRSVDSGSTWTEVDNDNIATGSASTLEALKIAISMEDSNTIYVCGYMIDSDFGGIDRWITKKSTTGASGSWSVSDAFTGSFGVGARAYDVAVSGTVVVVVGYQEDGTDNIWTIRRSPDSGANWATVDIHMSGADSIARAVNFRDDGAIYTAGISGSDVATSGLPLIRKAHFSSSATGSWFAVSDPLLSSSVHDIIFAKSGSNTHNVTYWVGDYVDATNIIVRRSLDDAAFETDLYTVGSYLARAALATSSFSGNDVDDFDAIYMVGSDQTTGDALVRKSAPVIEFVSGTNWLVRKSTDIGETWSTIYDCNFTGSEDIAYGIDLNRMQDLPTQTVTSSDIYVVGCHTREGQKRFTIRTTINSGTTWSHFSDFNSTVDGDSIAYAIDSDDSYSSGADGEYTVGTRTAANGKDFFTVLSGVAVETYDGPDNSDDVAYDVTCPTSGNIFMVGSQTTDGIKEWIGRHRRTGVSITPFFSYRGKHQGEAMGVISDGEAIRIRTSSYAPGIAATTTGLDGNYQSGSLGLYMVGYHSCSAIAASTASWMVFRSTHSDLSGIENFQIVDECQLLTGTNIARKAVAKDGNIYVCGRLGDQGAVRKYSQSPDEFEFVLTGSYLQQIELHGRLYDENDVYISNTGTFIPVTFNLDNPQNYTAAEAINTPHFSGTIEAKNDARMTFYVSASSEEVVQSGAFNTSSFCIEFKDNNSSTWSSYVFANKYGTYKGPDDDGFYKFTMNFFSEGVYKAPTFSFDYNKTLWRISASSGIYTFRDFKIEFNQALTDTGVKNYQEYDNQHNKNIFSYVSRNVMPKVDD